MIHGIMADTTTHGITEDTGVDITDIMDIIGAGTTLGTIITTIADGTTRHTTITEDTYTSPEVVQEGVPTDITVFVHAQNLMVRFHQDTPVQANRQVQPDLVQAPAEVA